MTYLTSPVPAVKLECSWCLPDRSVVRINELIIKNEVMMVMMVTMVMIGRGWGQGSIRQRFHCSHAAHSCVCVHVHAEGWTWSVRQI